MGPPCPPHWTFAARAAYFGDLMCPFCDHRNPAGAKFCNDCASPLHPKPCNECDAVNHQAATNCYKCGAAFPVSRSTLEATPVSLPADRTAAQATPVDGRVAASVTPRLSVASALRAASRVLTADHVVLAAIATVMMAVAYAVYQINSAKPDAIAVASQPNGVREHDVTIATPDVPKAVESRAEESRPVESRSVESRSVEPERTAALQAPIPATSPETSKRASAPRGPVRAPATKRASAHQRPMPERQATSGATPRAANSAAAARGAPRVAVTRKAIRPDRWQVMNVSLARCGGDMIARIVCDQRVRLHFCEGHWDKVPQCATRFTHEQGQ